MKSYLLTAKSQRYIYQKCIIYIVLANKRVSMTFKIGKVSVFISIKYQLSETFLKLMKELFYFTKYFHLVSLS